MFMTSPREFFGVSRHYQPLLRELGLTESESIFTDPRIVIWRSIPERENGTLDATLADGRPIRLHVKRYHPTRQLKPPGEQEADAILMLESARIPTVSLVAWGKLADGRSFLITEDLTGFQPADKLIHQGLPFDRLLQPTANLAAQLHAANLHHRDLYLCHFFAKQPSVGQTFLSATSGHSCPLVCHTDPPAAFDLRLIDPGRVKHLPWLFRHRWIIKDLAQFWYSAMQLNVPDTQRRQWLEHYASTRQLPNLDRLQLQVERKAAWIARHDEKLKMKQPARNISIPPVH
jgi:hypothetical protein